MKISNNLFRFFADGIVSMLTTADEPQVVVSQLRTRDVRNPQVSTVAGKPHS